MSGAEEGVPPASAGRLFSCGTCCPSSGAGPVAKSEEEEVEEGVRAELLAMKVSALKKRAKEAEVDEEKLEHADDADDVKGAIVALILEKMRAEQADREAPPASVKPHFSADAGRSSKAGSRFASRFGGKHCMLSYNWGVQEDVKAVRAQLAAAGVPTWMDIDGEPAGIATSAQMLLAG